jgi:hypothetical protein
VERAQREPAGRFNSLAHLIDVPALKRSYRRQRADAAVGVDGVTLLWFNRSGHRDKRVKMGRGGVD